MRKIFKEFKPDAVIGVGGYSSFPVLRFAQAKGIPTFIHEVNSFAGKSNIMLGKKATRIFVARMEWKIFSGRKDYGYRKPCESRLLQKHRVSREVKALNSLDWMQAKKTVLVSGRKPGCKKHQ